MRKLSPLLHRAVFGARNGAIAAVAAVVAYLPLHLLHIRQAFWSAIAAVAVVQSEFQSTQSTARDQLLGAAVGGFAGLCVLRLPGEHTVIYAVAVLLSMTVCWLFEVASASRLSGVTVTIMLLVPRADESAWHAVISRVSTVAWGVCISVATVWLAARLAAIHASTLELPVYGTQLPPSATETARRPATERGADRHIDRR